MKSTGIIRRVDELGRIVLPISLRNRFEITEKDPLEIFIEGSSIILRKYEPFCVFCDDTKNLIDFQGKLVCKNCINKLAQNNLENNN